MRAVNVGGTGKLPMAELREIATTIGFQDVRTYIQSGNLLFSSDLPEEEIRVLLEDALAAHLGTPVDVVIRSAEELRHIVDANPFPDAPGARVGVALSGTPVDSTILEGIRTPGHEEVVAGRREIYTHYPDGMGQSKFALPRAAGPMTVRNINTLTKLAASASTLQ
nr:DUF1697 domain-containing protein [Arthrobacter roseus]